MLGEECLPSKPTEGRSLPSTVGFGNFLWPSWDVLGSVRLLARLPRRRSCGNVGIRCCCGFPSPVGRVRNSPFSFPRFPRGIISTANCFCFHRSWPISVGNQKLRQKESSRVLRRERQTRSRSWTPTPNSGLITAPGVFLAFPSDRASLGRLRSGRSLGVTLCCRWL
jgi:hypothetical protein